MSHEPDCHLNCVNNDDGLACPICGHEELLATTLEKHINNQHFSESLKSKITSDYICPFCFKKFAVVEELEVHINVGHNDFISPAKQKFVSHTNERVKSICPVCGRNCFSTDRELASHLDKHYNPNQSSEIDICKNEALFNIIAQEENSRKLNEHREFKKLRAQYGMDDTGSYSRQSEISMEKAVYSGELSVCNYYERQIYKKVAEKKGLDDNFSCTKGLINSIKSLNQNCRTVKRFALCTTVDHYSSTFGDRGWGCAYRNIQMLFSSLQHCSIYESKVPSGPNMMLSVIKIQTLIEEAWRAGFDKQGCEQLEGKLKNTRKWIGATEVATLLSFLKIKYKLVDFYKPTGENGTHPELLKWCANYFESHVDFIPPLYLQHQGHSRTVVGVEKFGIKEDIRLLVFDPSHSTSKMVKLLNKTTAASCISLIRKSLICLKAKQYQIVAVDGVIESEHEYEGYKNIWSMHIPSR